MPPNFHSSHSNQNKVETRWNKENICIIECITNNEPVTLLRNIGPVALAIDTKPPTSRTSPSASQTKRPVPQSIEIYMSYVPKDRAMQYELEKQLRTRKYGELTIDWTDGEIGAGERRDLEIKKRLDIADIILIFLSVDYLISLQMRDIDMQKAIERHESGKARVIPILLRPCSWSDTEFANLQILPKDIKPLKGLPSFKREQAYSDIADEIREAIMKWARGH